jgi:hypothetical protein
VLRPHAARRLCQGDVAGESPIALGGRDHGSLLRAHDDFAGEGAWLRAAAALRAGKRAPNPLYAHLFAAFECAERAPELGLPDHDTQLARWLPWADPLEHGTHAFGLTPYGTLRRLRVNVDEHLARTDLSEVAGYADVRLRGDTMALARVRELLAACPWLPRTELDDAALRELFVLLCTHDRLFVTLE